MRGTLQQTPRRGLRLLQRCLPASSGGLVILLYHLVEAGTDCPVDLPLNVFRDQMMELRRSTRILRLTEAVRRLRSGEKDPRTAVVVTFDDAYDNFVSQALPVLEDLAIPVTLYIPVGFIDGTSPSPITHLDHLRPASWEDLRTAVRSGLVTPGSHTLTHPDLRRLTRPDAVNEVVRSREVLEDRLGVAVETFAYPRALAPAQLADIVRESYETAVVAGGVKLHPDSRWDPHALSRLPIRRDGPRSLAPRLRARVWLEEWIGAKLRRLRGAGRFSGETRRPRSPTWD